jgi:hypothetical protein
MPNPQGTVPNLSSSFALAINHSSYGTHLNSGAKCAFGTSDPDREHRLVMRAQSFYKYMKVRDLGGKVLQSAAISPKVRI